MESKDKWSNRMAPYIHKDSHTDEKIRQGGFRLFTILWNVGIRR